MSNNKISINLDIPEEIYGMVITYKDLYFPDLTNEEIINKILYRYLSRRLTNEVFI